MAKEIADSTLLDTWGSSGAKIEPDVSKIIEGWQLGEQPPHEYMNWLQNTFGSKLNHILKNGVALWNNETEYLAGSSVQHNGNVWLCKATNTNSAPTDANANWKRIITVESLTTLLNGYVATTGDQTIAGTKTFSSTINGNISGSSGSVPEFGIGAFKVLTETNLNNYLSGGKFITPGNGLTNIPEGWSQSRYTVDVTGGNSYALQLMSNPSTGLIATRAYNGSTWTNWKIIADTDGGDWSANDTRAKTALNASGSAPIYACRAWVNFNGTGTVAIRASGNVSSITDNGVGDYTVNFITDMADANYGVNGLSSGDTVGYGDTSAVVFRIKPSVVPTVSAVRVVNGGGSNSILDCMYGYIAIFR